MEDQRKIILKQLEEKQVKSSKDKEEYEVKVRSVNKILDQLKAGRSCSQIRYPTNAREDRRDRIV